MLICWSNRLVKSLKSETFKILHVEGILELTINKRNFVYVGQITTIHYKCDFILLVINNFNALQKARKFP